MEKNIKKKCENKIGGKSFGKKSSETKLGTKLF
jgi:hypothetical protein